MYIRWQRKKRENKKWFNKESGDLLTATLVEAHRIDGKPRQKVIGYLSSIRECGLDRPLHLQAFWQGVAQKLDELGIGPADREKLTTSLQKRVPVPTEGEIAGVYEKVGMAHEIEG